MAETIRVGIIENLYHINSFSDGGALGATTAAYSAAVGGNTGNLAFVLGSRLSLANPLRRIQWGTPEEEVKQSVDQIVICCANQIGKHANLSAWADRLLAFGLPVTLVGLGAQTPNYETDIEIPEGSMRFLEIASRLNASNYLGGNIGVRGEFTHNILKSVGVASTITGCPSLYISSDTQLGQTIVNADIVGSEPKIAVAAGNPYHAETRTLERQLVEIVEKTHGAYIVQHPDIMISLATGRLSDEDLQKLPHILAAYGSKFDADSIIKWFRRHGFAFYDAIAWMDFLRHYDGVVGPRYHGIALAVQAGRPAAVVHIDNRTRELAAITSIKSIPADAFKSMDMQAILDLIRWTPEEGQRFDDNRVKRATTFRNFIFNNGLIPSERLKTIAAGAAPAIANAASA